MQHLPAPIHHARDAAQLPVAIDYPAALALRQMSMVHDELPKYLLAPEVSALLQNPEMAYLLMRKAGVPEGKDRLTWPQTANAETPENGADEMTLEEWVSTVTAGMYVPSWE